MWSAKAKSILFKDPMADAARGIFAQNCAFELLNKPELILLVFPGDLSRHSGSWSRAHTVLMEKVILPAITLQEKMLCAINHFSMEYDRTVQTGPEWNQVFYQNLDKLDCKNLGKGRLRLTQADIKAIPSDSETKRRLIKLCAVTPALVQRETDDTSYGPPKILVKQQVLVALDADITKIRESQSPGFFRSLYLGFQGF